VRAAKLVRAAATVLAALRWRQDYYLFIIGTVAFTTATIGYQHRRRHRPGDTGHIIGMGTAYVAMLTAFYVDNGPHLPLWDRLPAVAFWLLPSAIGAPMITRAVIRARHATTGTTTSQTEKVSQNRGPTGAASPPPRPRPLPRVTSQSRYHHARRGRSPTTRCLPREGSPWPGSADCRFWPGAGSGVPSW
jgi:hypothetical protein